MSNLEGKNNIKNVSEKKSYREPQFKEIGKINNTTKGGSKNIWADFNMTAENPNPMLVS